MSDTPKRAELDIFEDDYLSYLEPVSRNRARKRLEGIIEQEIAEANQNIKICGKTVDEIVPILSALEIERATDIQVTMSNLHTLFERLKEEQQAFMREVMDDIIARTNQEEQTK